MVHTMLYIVGPTGQDRLTMEMYDWKLNELGMGTRHACNLGQTGELGFAIEPADYATVRKQENFH